MRPLGLLLFLAGLALFGQPATVAFGVALVMLGALAYGRAERAGPGGEELFTAGLLLVGVIGALAVVSSYIIALP